jgi:hypothetical protein
MWKNIAERDRPQMTIWRMRIACWMPQAHAGHVTIIAVPLQQRLHERASVLHYTYIDCIVYLLLQL